MAEVTYKDFAKLDIRLGTIMSVDIVEDADKLLRLTVDVGEKSESGEPIFRQIVSGIREFFTEPNTLVGKQCPFLINIEARSIRGLESQGMILAAGETDDFTLLHPADSQEAGTKIH